jgi:FAD/FMN-containing dehydrogenase
MKFSIQPELVERTPVLLQQYRSDITRDVISRFEKLGVSLNQLEKWETKYEIVYPWDDAYGIERIGYNRFIQVYPMMIVLAKDMDEIRWALSKSMKLGVKFSIKSGGHDHTGLSLSNGIIICLARRNHIILHRNYVDIGSGIIFGQLDLLMSRFGSYTAIHGTCSNVSTGLIYGGGFGLFTRKYGLSCDNVISFNILLADGRHITCDDQHHSDLFWALRGAGSGSFGIVTDLRLKYYKVPKIILYELHFTLDQFVKIYNKWQSFAPYAVNDLASKVVLLPAKSNDLPFIIKGQYLGSIEDFKKLMGWFNQRAVKSKIWEATVVEASLYHNEACEAPGWYFFYQSLLAVELLNNNLVDVLYNYMINATEGSVDHCLVINALGGKYAEPKETDTAYPWRDALLWLHVMSESKDQSCYDDMKKYVNIVYNELLDTGLRNPQTGVGRLYSNFKDLDLSDDKYPLAYWGEKNYKRLQAVKRKYDPLNVFHNRQSINIL